ncbi:MAG: 4-hydroxy-3-methylbut-2-enyl diphosphate reductase [Ignavibacteria bacterium]|nr:4-hydroxy-3-methylbut-2-enyl diphosphate reductase [Ignavibacteria bacterium]
MNIYIDESAGFCWGVVRTIDKVEETLNGNKDEQIYVLGNIIHNPREIERLANNGLQTINHSDFERISGTNSKVIIRAHGEAPSTYKKAKDLNIDLIDATCPLVTALQKRVGKFYEQGYQIVIYGKKEHAEIIGLRGVCNDECVVVHSIEEAREMINPNLKTVLLSQTTMDRPTFLAIKDEIESIIHENGNELEVLSRDTICKYVSDREPALREFSIANDVIIFVAGHDSSNGKILFNICKSENPNTHFIEDVSEIDYSLFDDVKSVGVTGATSTPQWYLNLVKETLESFAARGVAV